jgi:hypothetical protein
MEATELLLGGRCGTAVMIQVFHAFGSKEKGVDFLKKLQTK